MNRVGVADFCFDMGFSMKRMVNLEAEAVSHIAQLGGLDPIAASTLLSWTGEQSGAVRMTFRNETFVSRALKNPKVRGCPICLREDAQDRPSAPLEAIAMRGDWQLREVAICVRHQHPLVFLWERSLPTERFNIGARLGEIMEGLLEGAFELPRTSPTAYDLWLDQRLEDGGDETWLAQHSIYAATSFCRLLGTELMRLTESVGVDDRDNLRAAQSAGFDVAIGGETAINKALDKLAAHASAHNDLPNKAFGGLFKGLARPYLHEECFDVFRRILWERIVSIWPFAADEVILGYSLPERRLHSLQSAAKETGVGPFLLDQFLINAGAYSSQDTRPAPRKTFDAQKYADLLSEIPDLVGPIKMRSEMGATLQQFKALAEDDVLIPRIDFPTIKSPWRLKDGIMLVNELNEKAIVVAESDDDWEIIQKAKSRTKMNVGLIISAIRDGVLKVARRKGVQGYNGFCVCKEEIDQLVARSIDEIEFKPRHPEEVVVTASAFGRSVGMRENEAFVKLVRAGHTPASHTDVSKTGKKRYYVTEEDIAAFHQEYLTQSTMSVEFNVFWRTLITQLQTAKVKPFTSGNEEYGHLYLRTDVEGYFRSSSLKV